MFILLLKSIEQYFDIIIWDEFTIHLKFFYYALEFAITQISCI
jgi:hypothetical protein